MSSAPRTETVVTSTAHPGIERASAHLAAVLVGNGDTDAVLTSSEVILRLADVTPPLPPLQYPPAGPDHLDGIRDAVAAAIVDLRSAVDDAATTAGERTSAADEALRAAHGIRALLELLDRLDDHEPASTTAGPQR